MRNEEKMARWRGKIVAPFVFFSIFLEKTSQFEKMCNFAL